MVSPPTLAYGSSSLRLETPTTFPFPYPQPYSIQLDLMQTVFSAIEEGKIAIVESPTGTGKSLTLLTSTLSWLRANAQRAEKGTIDALEAKLRAEAAAAGDPPWVVKHALQAQVAAHQAAATERAERLRLAREKERKEIDAIRRRRAGVRTGGSRNERGYGLKRQRLNGEDEGVAVHALPRRGRDEQDAEFLPEDGSGHSANQADEGEESDGIRPELRALIDKYAGAGSTQKDEPEEETVTKIYYASRTHTQLRQLTSELLKTTFAGPRTPTDGDAPGHIGGEQERESLPVRMVPLGGRKQLCVNDRVRAIGARSGDERMNEACLELQKGDKKGRCEYLPPMEEKDRMVDFRDAILATVRDIEDIVEIGKDRKVCPYYAARSGVKQAELVTLPYNLLLQKNARDALGIDLKDQVIVIDEAHNLIDTLLSIYSVSLPLSHLITALTQLRTYHDRFKSRLKPLHALHIVQTLTVISGLISAIQGLGGPDSTDHAKKDKLCKVNELTTTLEGGADMVNLVDLVRYLKESKLARKVSSYVEKTIEEAESPATDRQTSQSAIAAFHQVETFLLSLADSNEDGRIVITQATTSNTQSIIRYMLLNPAEHFKAVVNEARCIVLAGGTMEPISDFLVQLFPEIPRNRISTLSCTHVIPPANLLAQVVRAGPSGKPFEFKMSSRGDRSLILELGACISSLINLIPDGVVVFFPSYTFLGSVKETWQATGLLSKLDLRKKVVQLFYEPQSGGDVEGVLRDYSLAIAVPNAGDPHGKRTGALLLAVVGAKLSEGINFSDSLGRAVIMVGLPFANLGSIELKERMLYVEGRQGGKPRAGQELYENLCMRAVNQSIGRAIRHANDYATLLLIDQRYSTSRISAKLPRWIGADLQVASFAEAVRGVATFFRGKKHR